MPQRQLTPEQERMYSSEKEENFRWLLKIVATQSPYVLSAKDVTSGPIIQELSDIGQFCEVAHGSIDPSLVWRFLPQLLEPGFPLHGYNALRDSELLRTFRADSHGGVQGYVAYRPKTRQLVLSFSGTSSPSQAIHDLKFWRTWYRTDVTSTEGTPRMHTGFWKMYQAVREQAVQALQDGLQRRDVEEMVFTAHSMGSALLYFLLLELLAPGHHIMRLPFGVKMKLAVFGSPRVGNAALVKVWTDRVAAYKQLHGDHAFQEWSIKAFDDGVPSMPPNFLGYRHFAQSPFYFYHSALYQIPQSEIEHSKFQVDSSGVPAPSEGAAPDFPLGGHNYYGGRDMEKLQRTMRWAVDVGLGRTDNDEVWKEAFLKKVKDDDDKWEAKNVPKKVT